MKNIYIIIISLFGLTLISCAKINSAMDDVNKKYDEFSKESDEPEKTSASTEKASIEKVSSFGFLFVSVGEKGTILTSCEKQCCADTKYQIISDIISISGRERFILPMK